MKELLHYSAEVAEAKANGQPIVALESTIITHGMPYPQNLETARLVESEIRQAGATPATIAVMAGRIHIGLDEDQLDALARSENVWKLSRADFAVGLSQGITGATTVAATMIAAHLAGISVFGTGGIGGVHRGAETSFDISADLRELSETPVTVVAAGAKAILDLEKTLEVLEDTWRARDRLWSGRLPGLLVANQRLKAPLRLDSANEIARAHKMRAQLGLPGGQLIANPIPAADAIPLPRLTPMIDAALHAAETQGVTGKAVTPFSAEPSL